MLSFLRGAEPVPRRDSSLDSVVFYEQSKSWQKFYPPGSEYLVQHGIPNNKSFFNPPAHLHLFNSEVFRCVRGTGVWHQPTAPPNEQRVALKAGDPPIFLPAGRFHRFENPSDKELLVVDIKINSEGSRQIEERFFRNFFGYLEDCRRHDIPPSIFQLELFLWTVDGPLAIPVPGNDWLKFWLSRIVMIILGVWIGKWLLGYSISYPEYYSEDIWSSEKPTGRMHRRQASYASA